MFWSARKNIVPTFDSDNGWEASPQVGGEKQERDDHCCARSPKVHRSAGLEYVVLKSSALLFK